MKNKLLLVRPSYAGRLPILERVLPEDGVKQGIYTKEVLGSCSSLHVIRSDGQQYLLAEEGRESPVRVGRYGIIDGPGFTFFIEPLFQKSKGLLYLDEIGLLHLSAPRFQALVCDYLASPNPLLAVISEEDHPFLNAVRDDPRVMVWHFDLHVRGLLEERIKE